MGRSIKGVSSRWGGGQEIQGVQRGGLGCEEGVTLGWRG